VTVGAVGLVEIGDFALIGPGCYITDVNHRFDDLTIPVPDQGMSSKGATVLEDNVWLGAHVVVTSGVRIGRRAVIGANSVVTQNIPEFSMATGIPAKVMLSHKPAGCRPAGIVSGSPRQRTGLT
jgi:acetyltransferase-like isoleucine patch superfamily enzyme